MAYSQKQIQDRALRVATMAGDDPNSAPVIDNSVVLEDLFESALRQAIKGGTQKAAEVGNLKRDHLITLTNGLGSYPDTVFDECLDDSTVYSTTDPTIAKYTSYQPRFGDYIRGGYRQLGYYAIQEPNFLFSAPGGNPGTYNGDIHLVAVSMPDIAATITDPITISTETAERCIQILAAMLKGAPDQ